MQIEPLTIVQFVLVYCTIRTILAIVYDNQYYIPAYFTQKNVQTQPTFIGN